MKKYIQYDSHPWKNDPEIMRINSIFEDDLNDEILELVTIADYKGFFKALERLDNKAPEALFNKLDGYFPLDTIDDTIYYLKEYLTFFKPSTDTKVIEKFINQLKKK